ncbi:hypothetical protein MGYG_09079 [Nannizzia gypsea CBS 118893]|uniref:Uncharacterized protein n=1 Tax=Arthroderma gypseum (strain ATCC MYA-4604 / CBS 118893) TaxID=535722 RepID=E4UVI3_ARTGP|nr:hypothetical protein MGYG_09079 [Nannizzia gypsea CBS 118893]EFR02310.1 hypothetical protein MGYG_09079 [Nannizzia gypsea CBS 118893]
MLREHRLDRHREDAANDRTNQRERRGQRKGPDPAKGGILHPAYALAFRLACPLTHSGLSSLGLAGPEEDEEEDIDNKSKRRGGPYVLIFSPGFGVMYGVLDTPSTSSNIVQHRLCDRFRGAG